MVVATHHRTALMRLVSGSVAAGVSDDSRVATLFLRDDSKGFIDLVNGTCHLESVLIPVGSEVDVEISWKIEAIIDLVAPYARIKMLHVGSQQPAIVYTGRSRRSLPAIDLRDGGVVETIVGVARDIGADLIAMPTEGRHGLSDALFGTTTERDCVRHRARCSQCRCRAIYCSRATQRKLGRNRRRLFRPTSTARITSPPRWLTSSIQLRTSL